MTQFPIGSQTPPFLRGRCFSAVSSTRSWTLRIRNEQGEHVCEVNSHPPGNGWVGHILQIQEDRAQILTPYRNTVPSLPQIDITSTLAPRRVHGTQIRARVESEIRSFFLEKGFKETRTPLLVPCPGMEPHIRPFEVVRPSRNPDAPETPLNRHRQFLPTSPEFAMKRLLVGGLEKIFQLCPAFRDEPDSPLHRSEFTMLEWYRAFATDADIQVDTENLVEWLAVNILGEPSVCFAGKRISVKTPWPRLRVRDLFTKHVGIDLTRCGQREQLATECIRLGLRPAVSDTWDDLYFRIWLNHIEPHLPEDQAVFVTRYPASQAALSIVDQDPDGSRWAKRFEAYAGGLELGNAFEELTDPLEQKRRFTEDMELRAQVYGPDFPPSPIDEGFLSALNEGMPPSAGIAMGVDRLVMLLAGESDINYTFWT